jgi:hypothetical protein
MQTSIDFLATLPDPQLVGFTGGSVILDRGEDGGMQSGTLLNARGLLGSALYERLTPRDQELVRRVADRPIG